MSKVDILSAYLNTLDARSKDFPIANTFILSATQSNTSIPANPKAIAFAHSAWTVGDNSIQNELEVAGSVMDWMHYDCI